MPQQQRTANDIIVRAYYLIGELSPDEIPSGSQITEGLYYLNDLLDHFSSLGILIPFIRNLTFDMTVGKDKYTISNVPGQTSDITFNRIVELDYVNVIREKISYPVRVIKRSDLFDNTRLLTIQTRPGYVLLLRDDLETTLQFYPVPEFAYEANIRAKFMLDHLELFVGLEQVPPYCNRFLRYALARELTAVFPSSNWTQTNEESYQTMLSNLTAATDLDMAIFTDNILIDSFGEFIYDSFGVFT